MKINIKKIGFVSFVIILMALVGVIVSCNKENNDLQTTNHPNNASTLQKGKSKVFGTYNDATKTFQLNFNREQFLSLYQSALIDSGYTNLIVEDVAIYDEDPMSSDSVSALKVSVFDTVSALGTTIFLPADKIIDDDSVTYSYSNKPEVFCHGINCYKGCNLNFRQNGCTGCKRDKNGKIGTCESWVYSSGSGSGSSIDIPAWMGVGLTIIEILIMLR